MKALYMSKRLSLAQWVVKQTSQLLSITCPSPTVRRKQQFLYISDLHVTQAAHKKAGFLHA